MPKRGMYDHETVFKILDEAFVCHVGFVVDGQPYVTEHIMKGRWEQIRWPNEQELKGTTVLALAIEEVSAKVRTGDPKDDEEDYELPIWAGVLPLPVVPAVPIPDTRLKAGIPVPENVAKYSRSSGEK